MRVNLAIVLVCLVFNTFAQDSSGVKISSVSFGFRPIYSPRYKGSEFIHFTKSKGVIDEDILLLPSNGILSPWYSTTLPLNLGLTITKTERRKSVEHLIGISYSKKHNIMLYEKNDSSYVEFGYSRYAIELSDFYRVCYEKGRWVFYSGVKFAAAITFKPKVYVSNGGNFITGYASSGELDIQSFPAKGSFIVNSSIPYGIEFRVLKGLSLFIEKTFFYIMAENIYGRKTSIYADYIDPPLPFLSMDLDNGLGMGLSYRF